MTCGPRVFSNFIKVIGRNIHITRIFSSHRASHHPNDLWKYVKEFTFTSYYPYIGWRISIQKFQGRPCLFGLAFCIYVESSIFPWVQRLSQRNPRMQSIRSVTHFLLLDLHRKISGEISPGFEKKTREETREISQGIAWFFTNGI